MNRLIFYIIIISLCQFTNSQTVVTPVFPLKDGEVSVQKSNGVERDILIDGTPKQEKKTNNGLDNIPNRGYRSQQDTKMYVKPLCRKC